MGKDNVDYKDAFTIKVMEVNKHNIGTVLICFAIGILVGMGLMDLITTKKESDYNVSPIDTSYNKVKLDSINVKIGKHDTTIYKLNIKLKDDVEKSYQLNDSAAVELFKQLATSTSSVK